MKRPDSSLVALTVGALGSAAANTAWTWDAGPVRVAAGWFTTALVPVAMHLWPRVPVTGWVTRGLRFVVMAYICGAAAVVNLAHAVMLLTGQQTQRAEHFWLAVLSITAVEALMVMASLARRVRPVSGSGVGSGSGVRTELGSVSEFAVAVSATAVEPSEADGPSTLTAEADPVLTPCDQQESVSAGGAVRERQEADPLTLTADSDVDDETRELIEKLTAWAGELGSVPSRERIRVRYAIGSKRADKIRTAVLTARQADPDPAGVDPLTATAVNT